ncbi:MAG: LacI family DNA-binding transcriptional regulator [Methanobacterium sp.]
MTIDEIAKLANTSKATVSLALNNKPGVNPETRKKILEIASSLGYVHKKRVQPNTSHKTNVIKLIAVLKPETSGIHNFSTSFFAELINSIQSRCAALGYNLVYTAIPHDNFVSTIHNQESSQQSDGIILIGTYLSENEISSIRKINDYLVVVDYSYSQESINTVVMNNFLGGYLAASFLLDLGHKNIGYISSNIRISNLVERSRGFFIAFTNRNEPFDESNIFSINSYHSHSVEDLSDILSVQKSMPSAFFCETDYNAICLVSALTKLGFNVPNDVSVVGFDNVPETRMKNPCLTTINVDKRAIGIFAVNRLYELITSQDKCTSLSILVNVNLIKRDSTIPFNLNPT